ncbi:MAG: 8-oxo-dGTP diphosphatase [Candidatus Woesearchaeota archaeon]
MVYIPKTIRTIVFLLSDSEVILGMKLRGFGKGKLNGYGGKLENDKTVEDAAVRELFEEAGVSADAKDLEKVAVIDFYFPFKPDFSQQVHVYFLKKWSGEPQETEEMKPETFQISNMPYDRMWDSDKLWLPMLIDGKKIKAFFEWKEDNDSVEYYKIDEVTHF